MSPETEYEMKSQIEQTQAINRLLRDYTKSQNLWIKQMRTTLIILAICFTMVLCSMIIGFFWYESQYDTTEVTTTTLETEGDNADINSVTNGNMYNDSAVHNEN